MRKLYKAGLVGVVIAALLVGVYFAGYHAAYERYANYHIDVGTSSLHIQWKIERLDGSVEYQYHAGVITLIGYDYMQDQIGDTASASTNVADEISLSTSTSTPLDSWTQIPTEITTGGLERATGTYTRSTSKVWTISHQFTASATHTAVQLTGLNWQLTPLTNNLFGADQFTPVTLNSGEKLTVTATVTLS